MAAETNADKIVKQVEYYFGDINLPRDKFLQETIRNGNDRWVPLDVMLKFKRLAVLSENKEEIAAALKNAKSELIEVSDDNNNIRRIPEVPESSLEYWQVIKERTAYVKGFGENAKLDDILAWCNKYGNVENVLMRRAKPTKVFKGSIFVTFKTNEEAKAFVENAEAVEFEDKKLEKMMQNDFWAQQSEENKQRRQSEKNAKNAKRAADNAERKESQKVPVFVKGLILNVEGIPTDSNMMDVKTFFKKFGDVGYVVYETNSDKAQIRFGGDEDGAKTAWEKAVAESEGGKVTFNGSELTATVLEGEAETSYWNDFNKQKSERNARQSGGRGGGRGGRGRGRGGRFGGNRGGRGGNRNAEKSEDAGEAPAEEKKSTKTVFADAEMAEPAKESAKRPAEAAAGESDAKKAKTEE